LPLSTNLCILYQPSEAKVNSLKHHVNLPTLLTRPSTSESVKNFERFFSMAGGDQISYRNLDVAAPPIMPTLNDIRYN